MAAQRGDAAGLPQVALPERHDLIPERQSGEYRRRRDAVLPCLGDPRHRVMRVAELHASEVRDIFTFAIERTAAGGAIEGSFVPSGVIPRIAEEWASRGGTLDSAVFKRERG